MWGFKMFYSKIEFTSHREASNIKADAIEIENTYKFRYQ